MSPQQSALPHDYLTQDRNSLTPKSSYLHWSALGVPVQQHLLKKRLVLRDGIGRQEMGDSVLRFGWGRGCCWTRHTFQHILWAPIQGVPHSLGLLSRIISSEAFQHAEHGNNTWEGMEEQNTLQKCSHRMRRWAAKDKESAKNKLFVPYVLGVFCSAKTQGQPTGEFIPVGLAYWNNRERDTFLEILLLGRETIAIDFICWVFRSYSDGEQYVT